MQNTVEDIQRAILELQERKEQIQNEFENLEEEEGRIDDTIIALNATVRFFQDKAMVEEEVAVEEATGEDLFWAEDPEQGEEPEPLTIKNAIYNVMVKADGPLTRTQILDRLEAAGFQVPGKSPINTMSAALSADERFINIERGVWGVMEEAV